jgi:glycyl-tRNA synthetase beta chain
MSAPLAGTPNTGAEDFLLELRSEEIPARMQEKARADLAALFEARLQALNLPFERIESYATPRRLALIVRGVAEMTAAASEERKGPRADAPAQAIEGFLRKTGLAREQLVETTARAARCCSR